MIINLQKDGKDLGEIFNSDKSGRLTNNNIEELMRKLRDAKL